MIVLEANATKHFKQKDNYNSNINVATLINLSHNNISYQYMKFHFQCIRYYKNMYRNQHYWHKLHLHDKDLQYIHLYLYYRKKHSNIKINFRQQLKCKSVYRIIYEEQSTLSKSSKQMRQSILNKKIIIIQT